MGATQSQCKLPLDEQIKIHQKTIKQACRDLEREKNALKRQEQKTIMEMKKLAKQNQVNSVKIMAKDLVRSRKYQTRFIEMKAQLQGVGLQLQTMKSQESMTNAMKGITKVMVQMNKKMNVQSINETMAKFMSENEKQKLTQEVMSEAIDDAMEDDEMEEENVVSQILDEIGIEMNGNIANVGTGKIAQPTATAANADASATATTEDEDNIEARLAALKR